MSKPKKFSEQDKTIMLKSLEEGKVQTISKDILGDQKTIQVGSNLDNEAKVQNTKSFEEFKQIYKNTIDDRCMQDYGSIDDKKLWEDCAKEMYLQSENYIPSDEDKPVEDLDSKQLKKESKKYKISDQEINDLYDRMRDFAKNELKIENETQLDNYMKENMPLWIEIYQDLHSCNESKSLNENLDISEITWDNINEYNTEEQHKIIDILNNLDLEVVDSKIEDETISIAIKDKFSGITFWMDYTKDSEEDLIGDWDQYIFHKSNMEDKIKKAIQSSYNKNTNETIAFDQFDRVAYDYIEQNNLNKFYNVTENCKDLKTESKQTNIEELKDDILSCDFIDYIQEIVDNLQDEKLKQKCNDCIQQLTKWFGTPKNSKQLEPYKVCLYRILDTYKMEENVQKQANLTDGVKKQIAEQYIEENKEALEQCKGLNDIINNHLKTICTKYCVLQPVGKDVCAYIYNILNSKK